MTLILAIINWFSGSTFVKIAEGVVSVLNKKTDAKIVQIGANKEVDIESIRAGVSVIHEQANLASLRWGWWGTRWLMVAAALPPIIHSGAVYLDSTFRFGWAIARAPGVYEGQETTIIATVVGTLTVQSLAGSFLARR